MKIKCGWCEQDMGTKPPFENKSETTGICPDCFRTLTNPPVCAKCGRLLIRPQHLDYIETGKGKVCMPCKGGS